MKKFLLTAAMLVCILSVLSAADVALSIRFFDKRIYYVQGAVEEPIYIQVTISNTSPQPYRFKLADERVFSVDFDVRTAANRPVEAADLLVRKRTQSQQVFFREVSVESMESFSFIEDLREYANLDQSGSFVVQARMYPNLYQKAAAGSALVPLESNRLSLSVRPAAIYDPKGLPYDMDVDTGAVLVKEKLPPDQVVSYMLDARQHSQWEKFFLYLDVESMLGERDAASKRQMRSSSEEEKQRMIVRYRQDLQSGSIKRDLDIIAIPSDYFIEQTAYTAAEGRVTVMERFLINNNKFIEKKRYTYYLKLKDGIWMITDYMVQNLGTE